MTKVGKGKVRSVTMFIQWREENAWTVEDDERNSKPHTTAQSQKRTGGSARRREERGHKRHAAMPRHEKRLLATDRIILNALCARVPRGKKVTTKVRVGELMKECEISRRQVQICLRRLSEKGFIKRLHDGVKLGRHEGCSYQISEDVLRK